MQLARGRDILQFQHSSGWIGATAALSRRTRLFGNRLADNGFGQKIFVQIAGVGSHGCDPITQDRDTICQRYHFVEEVRDEEDGLVFYF